MILLISLASCNRNKEVHNYIPQNIKDAALFEKNSYWVFLNERTLEADCTYVKFDPEFFSVPYMGNSTFEGIEILFDGKPFITETLHVDFVDLETTLADFHVITDSNNDETLDSLYINANKFFKVSHHRMTMLTYANDSIIVDSYLVPHVGIVKLSKRELGTDTTYSVLRWKVIQ
ncbi:MAG TPA: hypothetical protein VMC08_00885 [Bacteroidales bacterium]|nr:hypothetical protein [Bacteroidales bacterium]